MFDFFSISGTLILQPQIIILKVNIIAQMHCLNDTNEDLLTLHSFLLWCFNNRKILSR